MKPDVLVTGMMMPHVMTGLAEQYTLHKLYEASDRSAFLAEVGPKIRAIATGGHPGPDAAMIDACPKLEIISSFGVGTDAIDVEHAKVRGVPVCNTPDVLNDEVANTAIALLLATTRKIVAYDRYVRHGRWVTDGVPPLTRGLAGKTIGIVGMGRIGQTIAEKLKAFHCDIAYFARNRRDVSYRYVPDLVELASQSFALIIIVPGGKETEKLIDRRVMDALGPEGTLINIARGSVVDETALVAALEDGRLGAAGLDVFEKEPQVPEALFSMPNVVLQPHQGSATVETRKAMGDLVLANLAAHFAGEKLLTPLF